MVMSIDALLDWVKRNNPHEPEFYQATASFLESVEPVLPHYPEWERLGIWQRLLEPDRIIQFRVTWVDDQGRVQVNRGYRVQYSQALGPYKGGIRFHPSVNPSILKFLAFEQTFKNALTGLPLGSGKGGSDFDPKGKSDSEVMRFCHQFMLELFRHIGKDTDVPAGDLGVGVREIGYMYGMYKRLSNRWDGTFTGKGMTYGGSVLRPEATGYGLCYFMKEYLEDHGLTFENSRVIISGAGNVAIHAAEKAMAYGANVVAMSDSKGTIYDERGIDLDLVKRIKGNRLSLSEYVNQREAEYVADPKKLWEVPCTIALPCATQNEVELKDAMKLVDNGCRAVGEGANMPCTPEAIQYFRTHCLLFAPGKAANAGGVAVSGLEMSQNAGHLYWSAREVDQKLKDIMSSIYKTVKTTAERYGKPDDLMFGANASGLIRVGTALVEQGIL